MIQCTTQGGRINTKQFIPINHRITAKELRVLDELGKQIGIMTKEEALRLAEEQGKDVVEIVSKANPPVAKIISFSKYKYQLQQKLQEDKKKSKISDIKELRLTPVIAAGDFEQRVKRAREFLEDGDKVRFVVKFKGRLITRKEFGEKVVNDAIEKLNDISAVEIPIKMMGKMMMVQLMPTKKKVKTEQQQG